MSQFTVLALLSLSFALTCGHSIGGTIKLGAGFGVGFGATASESHAFGAQSDQEIRVEENHGIPYEGEGFNGGASSLFDGSYAFVNGLNADSSIVSASHGGASSASSSTSSFASSSDASSTKVIETGAGVGGGSSHSGSIGSSGAFGSKFGVFNHRITGGQGIVNAEGSLMPSGTGYHGGNTVNAASSGEGKRGVTAYKKTVIEIEENGDQTGNSGIGVGLKNRVLGTSSSDHASSNGGSNTVTKTVTTTTTGVGASGVGDGVVSSGEGQRGVTTFKKTVIEIEENGDQTGNSGIGVGLKNRVLGTSSSDQGSSNGVSNTVTKTVTTTTSGVGSSGGGDGVVILRGIDSNSGVTKTGFAGTTTGVHTAGFETDGGLEIPSLLGPNFYPIPASGHIGHGVKYGSASSVATDIGSLGAVLNKIHILGRGTASTQHSSSSSSSTSGGFFGGLNIFGGASTLGVDSAGDYNGYNGHTHSRIYDILHPHYHNGMHSHAQGHGSHYSGSSGGGSSSFGTSYSGGLGVSGSQGTEKRMSKVYATGDGKWMCV